MPGTKHPLNEESIRILQALQKSGGRLHGRLDRDVPFQRTDPTHPDPDWRSPVPVSVAEELHDAGLIEIDEAAPIRDIYTFQVSREGNEFLSTAECHQKSEC
jgi:hypothetical protein